MVLVHDDRDRDGVPESEGEREMEGDKVGVMVRVSVGTLVKESDGVWVSVTVWEAVTVREVEVHPLLERVREEEWEEEVHKEGEMEGVGVKVGLKLVVGVMEFKGEGLVEKEVVALKLGVQLGCTAVPGGQREGLQQGMGGSMPVQ